MTRVAERLRATGKTSCKRLRATGKTSCKRLRATGKTSCSLLSVVDPNPYPDWIRIQWIRVRIRIRIRHPDPGGKNVPEHKNQFIT
jgi:hypothetical protein